MNQGTNIQHHSYPRSAAPGEVAELVLGFIPSAHSEAEHTTYTLRQINLAQLRTQRGERCVARSAAQWDKVDPRTKNLDYPDFTPSWQKLEQAIREGGNTPPLVIQDAGDGTFTLLDGHHRASLAAHVGLHQLPAYVGDIITAYAI